MEAKVEEIMTGKVNIEKVLQENKEKIQKITVELEEIVRKGYFDILGSTENLVSLFNSQFELPSLTLPQNIEIPQKIIAKIDVPVEDQVWDLINVSDFVGASEVINSNLSKESIQKLKKHLLDPYFYSVFELGNKGIDRVRGFALLKLNDHLEIDDILKFVCEQLLLKLFTGQNMDNYLLSASTLIENSFDSVFFKYCDCEIPDLQSKITEKIKIFLEPSIPDLQSLINSQIQQIQHFSDLIKFISQISPKFGFPQTWDLALEKWEVKAEEMLSQICQLDLFENLSQTLEKYEEKTSKVSEIIEKNRPNFEKILEKAQKIFPETLFSHLAFEESPILLLGFIKHFKEISLSKLFPCADFSGYENRLLLAIEHKFFNKSILEVCQEVKQVCGEKQLTLGTLNLRVSECRKGFAKRIGLFPNAESEKSENFPEKKPLLEKLSLASRFSPHLILN